MSGINKLDLQFEMKDASRFANLALNCITREFPNAPSYVLNNETEIHSPKTVHPAFYGCFDWHSSVHSHWMLVRLLRLFPELPEAETIREKLKLNLSQDNVGAETAYFLRPNSQSFERIYGWAWLLKLAEELYLWQDPEGQALYQNLEPLAELLGQRFQQFLPRQTYPIRAGTHPNTSFGLGLALDFSRSLGNVRLEQLIIERSLTYFRNDKDIPARLEPDGSDFLSPSLTEAELLARILKQAEFKEWFEGLLPGLSKGEPANLLNPILIPDYTDPLVGHLGGLNLSRAWCMNRISVTLPENDPLRKQLELSATRHAQAGLGYVFSGNYNGEHWMATFAVFLLSQTMLSS